MDYIYDCSEAKCLDAEARRRLASQSPAPVLVPTLQPVASEPPPDWLRGEGTLAEGGFELVCSSRLNCGGGSRAPLAAAEYVSRTWFAARLSGNSRPRRMHSPRTKARKSLR